jgi:hypothetical protein
LVVDIDPGKRMAREIAEYYLKQVLNNEHLKILRNRATYELDQFSNGYCTIL